MLNNCTPFKRESLTNSLTEPWAKTKGIDQDVGGLHVIRYAGTERRRRRGLRNG